MSAIDTLMEMGFPRYRVEKALSVAGPSNVEAAMEWLLTNPEDCSAAAFTEPVAVPATEPEKSSETGAAEMPEGGQTADELVEGGEEGSLNPEDSAESEAKSIICDECGKKMKFEGDVQVHATRTGHASFSESTEDVKALTEEEKTERVEKLQKRLQERRQEKLEIEKQSALDKEKIRRKTGKELTAIKQKHEIEESKKLADAKKREKMEEKLARQRVKDQIERDKVDRAEKFARRSGGDQMGVGATTVATSTSNNSNNTQTNIVQQPKKLYTETRIQIRLTNGNALTHTFNINEPLSAVRLFVQMNRNDGDLPIVFMTNFPRKIYTEEDMERPLSSLELVPSAVLILTKPSTTS